MNEQAGSSSLVGMSFDKLDGTNYRLWVMRMTHLLQREGLWELTTEEEPILEKPDPDSKEENYERKLDRYELQRRRIYKAIGTLCLGMTDGMAVGYSTPFYSTPARIWQDIGSKYETTVSYDTNYLQRELYECRLEEEGTVMNYLNKIREIRDKLAISGETPTHKTLIFHIFEGLPTTQEWEP